MSNKNFVTNTASKNTKRNYSGLSAKVLLIEDDIMCAEIIAESLKKEGIIVDICTNGAQALKIIDKRYNLVVLDIQLPDMSGMDILNNLPQGVDCPPIMVWSGSCTVAEQIAAWQTGHILDFVEKPVNVTLLLERLKNRLYISNNMAIKNYQIKIGAIKFDLKKKIVQIYDQILHLSQKEYSLLAYLVQNCDSIIEKSIIMDTLYYKAHTIPDAKILDVLTCKLRSKIEEFDPFRIYIETQWARGYVISANPKYYPFAQLLSFTIKSLSLLMTAYLNECKIHNLSDQNLNDKVVNFTHVPMYSDLN